MSSQKKLFHLSCEMIAFMATCMVYLVCLYPLIILMFLTNLFMEGHTIDKKDKKEITVGIFHPYCNAGTEEEKVLWSIIKVLQSNYKNLHIFIYTGDLDHDREKILDNVEKVFNLKMQDNINIVYLHRRKWVENRTYPFCSLIGQTIGSIWLGWEAFTLFKPDIYIDTMGYAFTYPLFKYYGGCKVISYTHNPMISTDMLENISAYSVCYSMIKNPVFAIMKLGYYKAVAFFYSLVGKTADVVMVNSSWTKKNITSIWKCPRRIFLLYPPCDVEKLLELSSLNESKENDEIRIVSVSQFRPEKNHMFLLKLIRILKFHYDDKTWQRLRLVLIGSSRNRDDKLYIEYLKTVVKTLSLDDNVEFKVDIEYSKLISELQKGTIGVHTMWNEHFGISVVDGLAAGLIMVANASGGPKYDIINVNKNRNGFLASDVNEYAGTIVRILNMSLEKRNAIRNAARKSINQFSSERFEKELINLMDLFFK